MIWEIFDSVRKQTVYIMASAETIRRRKVLPGMPYVVRRAVHGARISPAGNRFETIRFDKRGQLVTSAHRYTKVDGDLTEFFANRK